MIVRGPRPERYTVVSNAVIEDSRLSFRARGLLIFILSKPDDWRIGYRALAKETHEGDRAIRSALSEIEACGYRVLTPIQDPATGRWRKDSIVYDNPELARRAAETAARRSRKTAGHTERRKPTHG